MDAAYYHLMADRLETGKGFTEPVIWHYLNSYDRIERPIDYWLPLGIVFFYLSRLIAGASGEVWLNIIIWSSLSAMVYFEVKKITNSPLCSTTAFLLHVFHGPNLFYVLTTDNNAFMAAIGFLCINSVTARPVRQEFSAVICALYCLMRIEGFFFSIATALIIFLHNRSLSRLILFAAIISIFLSPWILRNFLVLGKAWPSNSKALFLHTYECFFNETFTGGINEYLALGWQKILEHRLTGFAAAVNTAIALPNSYLMLPFSLIGIISCFYSFGRIFAFFVGLAVFLCTAVFPIQAANGTALHMSSFFYPHYAIFAGIGIYYAGRHYRLSQKVSCAICLLLIIWNMVFSFYSLKSNSDFHTPQYQPYIELFAKVKTLPEDRIASVAPIYVYLLTRNNGITAAFCNTAGPFELAERYGCNLVVIDRRKPHKDSFPPSSWVRVEEQEFLSLYRKIK